MKKDKQKLLKQVLLVLFILLVVVNLLVLDIKLFLKTDKKEIASPTAPTAAIVEKQPQLIREKEEEKEKPLLLEKEPTVDFQAVCQKEISRALATLSAQPQPVVEKISQQVSAPQPKTVYFPLGGGVSTTNRSWSYVGGAEGYFDKLNYQGAETISLEVFLRVKHGAGEAQARLYDATNGVVISNSQLSAGEETFSLKTSPALNLLDGNNLYQVQLRSSTGYEAFMDGARLKIDF